MWIDRDMTGRLRRASAQFPALLLTGARQTGKTSLLRRAFPRATYVSLDLPSLAAAAEENPRSFLQEHSTPLIIDEIQYAPGLFRYLKVAIDADRHAMGRFLLTGSQKFGLMRGVSESLAGRCAVLQLDTLTAAELTTRGPTQEAIALRGGFPELWRQPDLSSRDFFGSYVATYLERDVRSAARVGSLRDFERFLRACAWRSGQLLNLTELGADVGIAGSTARDWLSVLEASDQLMLLEPYFGNPTKRMVKSPKLYLRDTGLLCFLCGIAEPRALAASPFVGAIWETFVLQQLCHARHISASMEVYFWRDAHGTEVDFVLDQGGVLRLVEAKWAEAMGTRPQGALASLLKVRASLGERAAAEHWVACRTAHDHLVRPLPGIRAIAAGRLHTWLRSTA